ncbi:MAG: twin-arginine translocase TatA/TatE family subunit [Gammaproteobacteria bacterium]|nr:twin-arginine translocase TatA/TatE family subunit [Gammaproteobacteria bacterium]
MGLGGISIWQLVIILIVFLLTIVAAPALHAHRSRNANTAADDEAGKKSEDASTGAESEKK